MKKEPAIPQHDLKGSNGEILHFDFAAWGEGDGHEPGVAHRHNFHEILVFEKGGGTHDIDFKTFETRSRSVHFVSSHSVHLMFRQKASAGYSLLFSPGYLPDELMAGLPFSKANPVLQLNEPEFGEVNQLAQKIKTEHHQKQPFYQPIVRGAVHSLMYYLLRVCREKHATPDISSYPHQVTSFIRLLERHYTTHRAVADYATMLHISAKHLIDLCRRHTGKTPLQLIREHTITEARKLLFYSGMSIKEIAYTMGFDEPANFSKFFKAATGTSPGTYRVRSGGK